MDKEIEKRILKINAAYSERDFQNIEEPVTEIELIECKSIKVYLVKFYYKNIAIFKSYHKFPKIWDKKFEMNKIKWLLVRHYSHLSCCKLKEV